jgi:hypothetical protein
MYTIGLGGQFQAKSSGIYEGYRADLINRQGRQGNAGIIEPRRHDEHDEIQQRMEPPMNADERK